MVKQWLAWAGAALIIGMSLARCGSSSKSSPSNPSPATPASSIPESYTTESCATCHGTDASALPPSGDAGHVIKGTTLTEAAFLAVIRTGETAKAGGVMSAYTATNMSDADVQTLYNYATGH